jgi:ribonuclease D
VYLVDPLALPDVTPLGEVVADPGTVKVLHGAAYDVASMKRDFGFRFAGLFDTMLAAQFLGLPEVGLAALLRRLLGVESGESRQKDDWAARPLTPAQERYAADDVRHLIALRAHLVKMLTACGRESWVEEECVALEATLPTVRVFRPEDCFQIKGARDLDRRGLAALRELFVAREAWAHAGGRPPFKVLGNDTLVRLASERPTNRAALTAIPGCTPTVLHRYGDGIVEAIARAGALPDAALPLFPRARRPRVAPTVAARMAALAVWRTEAAARLGLDAGLLLPRRLIERVAETAPRDPGALAGVDGIRRWRIAALGREILEASDDRGSATTRERVDRTAGPGGEESNG